MPNEKNEVSIYSDDIANPKDIAISMNRLRVAFPKMGTDFFNILAERLIDNGFTGKRLNDAVNHVLDTFQYKELNISDVVKFDRKVKLYTYSEVCQMVTAGKASFSDFEIREVGEEVYRVMKKDLV